MEEVGDEWRGYFCTWAWEEGVVVGGGDEDGWMKGGGSRLSWVSLPFTSVNPPINSESVLPNPVIGSSSQVLMFGCQGNAVICWVTGSNSTFPCLHLLPGPFSKCHVHVKARRRPASSPVMEDRG